LLSPVMLEHPWSVLSYWQILLITIDGNIVICNVKLTMIIGNYVRYYW
jgi:hypothetical protein